jgi:hypothetical protein
MKNINHILRTAALVLMVSACTKDPFDGIVSNERAVEAVNVGGDFVQVGPAIVDRTTSTASVRVLVQEGTDFSKVPISIISSYKSKASIESGTVVDFESHDNKTMVTVTAESGMKRDWTIEVVPFTEELLGTYDIQQLVIYGGTGPEWGGGAVMNLTDKPWDWPAEDGPAAELDNTLTFEFTGVTADGKTYGTITNDNGDDNLYADFHFIGSPDTDVNHFYRVIPEGTGTWQHDYSNNTVTFVFDNGSTATANFTGASTIDLGNGLSKTITDNSFDFTLNGADDWVNIYTDYDKFVQRPRRYWVDVKKQ